MRSIRPRPCLRKGHLLPPSGEGVPTAPARDSPYRRRRISRTRRAPGSALWSPPPGRSKPPSDRCCRRRWRSLRTRIRRRDKLIQRLLRGDQQLGRRRIVLQPADDFLIGGVQRDVGFLIGGVGADVEAALRLVRAFIGKGRRESPSRPHAQKRHRQQSHRCLRFAWRGRHENYRPGVVISPLRRLPSYLIRGLMPKTILITGASRGIGRAAALMAGRRGWSVGVNYVRDEEAAQTRRSRDRALGRQRPSPCMATSPSRRTSSRCSTAPRVRSVRSTASSSTPASSRRLRGSPI